MSADVLRRAAALMRERAEAASPGVWAPLHSDRFGAQSAFDTGLGRTRIDELSRAEGAYRGVEDATHIASWHPVVALAVADWLEATAVRCELARDRGNHSWRGSRQAVKVARAYLGESA